MTDHAPDVKALLKTWADAYGGDQYRRLGYASNDALGPACGQVESAARNAERIEHIVAAMERQGRWKEGRVLRAEVFMAALPEAERIARLRRIGVQVSRTAYYAYLRTALAFVDGALTRNDSENAA